MLAANLDLTIDRAADYSFILSITNVAGPVNLAASLGPPAVVAAVFYADIRNTKTKIQAVEFDYAFTNGSGSDGQVTFSISKTDTKLLYAANDYEYDIFMDKSGKRVRLLEGKVTVRNNRTNEV